MTVTCRKFARLHTCLRICHLRFLSMVSASLPTATHKLPPRTSRLRAAYVVWVLVVAVSGCAPALRDGSASVKQANEAKVSFNLAAIPAQQLETVAVASEPVESMPQLLRPGRKLPSPNGEKIALIEEVQQGLESTAYQISIVNPSGGDAVTIARPINLSDLAWSPGGAKLAYCEGTTIHVVDSDGATRQRLYVGPGGSYPGACFNLEWSDDGRQLSFIQVENVDRLDISHPVEVVLRLGVKTPH